MHAKLLADQVEESTKRKLKSLEKSLELEDKKKKLLTRLFEARCKVIVADNEIRFDKSSHVSHDNNSIVSKSSLGYRLLGDNI